MTSIYLYIRAHLIAGASYMLVGTALAGMIFHLPPNAVFLLTLGAFILAVYGFIDERFRIASGVQRGDLTRFGKVAAYCGYPKPGTSMINALKRAGVSPREIQSISIQTCTFGNKYLREFKEFLVKTGVRSETELLILGTGDELEKASLLEAFPKAKLCHSTKKLTTHFSLLESTDGRTFAWYEPDHQDSVERYIPSKGAFLVEVNDTTAARARFSKDSIEDCFLPA